MTSYIAILSLLLVSALIQATEVNGLDTTPFKCVQCTDCTSPESVKRLIVCNDLLSTNDKPHCTTTYTNDSQVHRGCCEAGTARQDGCRQLVDEKTREPELVCSCDWSECNAPKLTIRANADTFKNEDDKASDKIWIPKVRYTELAIYIILLFAGINLMAVVIGVIVSSLKCCRGSSCVVESRAVKAAWGEDGEHEGYEEDEEY